MLLFNPGAVDSTKELVQTPSWTQKQAQYILITIYLSFMSPDGMSTFSKSPS